MNFLRGPTINFTMRFIPKHYGSYFYVDPSYVEKISKVKKICVTPILYLSELIRNSDLTQKKMATRDSIHTVSVALSDFNIENVKLYIFR